MTSGDSDKTDTRLKVAVDWKRRNGKEKRKVLKESIELVTQLLHKIPKLTGAGEMMKRVYARRFF